MIVSNATVEEFNAAVVVANLRYEGNLQPLIGTAHSKRRFNARVVLVNTGYQLGLKDTRALAPGQRRSGSGRRCNAVCWHGYRDVLIALFDINPEARVYTALSKYRGKAEFWQNFPATGDQNIGSMIAPLCIADACDCEV